MDIGADIGPDNRADIGADIGPDISIAPRSAVPPFEQLRAQLAAQVTSGVLPAGTRLPTVRRLAADLGLAANTVARAYRELEADGVVATHGRRGTMVSSAVLEGTAGPGLAESYVHAARQRGLTLAEALGLVERAWGRNEARHPEGDDGPRH